MEIIMKTPFLQLPQTSQQRAFADRHYTRREKAFVIFALGALSAFIITILTNR